MADYAAGSPGVRLDLKSDLQFAGPGRLVELNNGARQVLKSIHNIADGFQGAAVKQPGKFVLRLYPFGIEPVHDPRARFDIFGCQYVLDRRGYSERLT
jgi:hypothetical protein